MNAFLLYRYAVVFTALLALWGIVRYRSILLGLGLVGALGVLSWFFTWAPLQRPYGLEPGTETSLDTAFVSAGAARGVTLEGWVSGTRNPMPVWSLFWFALAPKNPERARALLPFATPVLMVLIPCAVFGVMRSRGSWAALACAFTAVLASSVPIDALEPYSLFYKGIFFSSPHRALGLLVALGSLGAVWQGTVRGLVAGGILLGTVGWIDVIVFLWAALILVAETVLSRRRAVWLVLLFSSSVAAPQVFSWFRGELLLRIPSSVEVDAFRLAFRDLFAATTDMGWIFVLAACAFPLFWKNRNGRDVAMFSILLGSYALWIAGAVWFHVRPFADPNLVFHLLRFGTAIAAGASGFELALRLISRLQLSRRFGLVDEPASLAFAGLLVFLLPTSAAFLWRPLQMDPLYYQGFYEWDPSIRRLERWVLVYTHPDDLVLTGEETAEWIASLTGRRVFSARRVLDREEERRRRRLVRGLFLSGDPETMREAIDEIGARVLVLDPELREVYWRFDDTMLEDRDLFEKARQIGDRYSIYLSP